jgi:hypothetical protein
VGDAPVTGQRVGSVIIRSYPKAVFFYPTFLTAIVCAILAYTMKGEPYHRLPGDIFFTVFAVNILITAWDFSKSGFVAVILLVVIAVLAVALIQVKVDFLHGLKELLGRVQLKCHPHVYLMFAAIFGFLLFLAFVQSRLDYWEVHGNELIHVSGFVGNVERFPAPNLRFRKELPDVFEYTLLRSGTLVLEPVAGERHPLVNVVNINSIERRIEALLSTIDVTIEQPPPRPNTAPPPT